MNRPASKTVQRRFFLALARAIHVAWPVLSIILVLQVALGLLIGLVERSRAHWRLGLAPSESSSPGS